MNSGVVQFGSGFAALAMIIVSCVAIVVAHQHESRSFVEVSQTLTVSPSDAPTVTTQTETSETETILGSEEAFINQILTMIKLKVCLDDNRLSFIIKQVRIIFLLMKNIVSFMMQILFSQAPRLPILFLN